MLKAAQSTGQKSGETRSPARNAIIPVAVAFFTLQAIGTVIAIANNLPYEVGGHGDPNTVGRDFLMGGGTALSGPLALLVILAILIGMGRRPDRWGTLALVITAILGTVATVFGALEPIAGRMLQASPFGLFEAMVVVQAWGSVLASAAIAVLSLLVVIGRSRNAAAFNRQPG